jgi:arylsulfatase A-like enzyme
MKGPRPTEIFWLASAAGLACGAVEAAWLAATCARYFDGPLELLRMVLVLVSVGAALGAMAGLLEAGVTHAFDRGGSSPRRRALMLTALGAPPIVFVCVRAFEGPQARALPGRWLIVVALAAGGCAALYLAQRRVGRVPSWLGALGALALYAADQKILPRLYPFFHQGLGVLTFAAVQLALWRRLPSRRWLWPSLALFALGGAFSFARLGHERALRTLLVERAVWEAPALRLSPAPPRRNVHLDADAAGAALPPLPLGPRLGDVDVFVITIDAFRADRLNARTAPHLTALAEQGARFERAYAQVPHTSFSIATLLTGKYVYSLSELGLEAAGHQTLAEVMKRERYKTAAFYPPSVFYIDHGRLAALEASAYGFEYVKYEYLKAPERTQQVIDFLETEKPRRAFVWVHYLEPHEPYDPHPGHTLGDSAEARYDGEIHFVDAEVARLVEYLRAHRPHALLVVAADHGEELGEHGGHYHGTTLYEEQVRVPLFLTPLDDHALPARRVGGPVGLVDVAPTILPLVGIAPSAKMRGRDLGPWLSPPGAPDSRLGPVFSEIDRKKMIVDGSLKLICDLSSEACQLYDLAADPAERHDLADQRRDDAERLRAKLESWMAEETRFESPALAVADPAARRVLMRGRMGEGAAAPELARLLSSNIAAVREEAARLLSRLPPDPSTQPFLVGDDPWVRIARARLGDRSAPLPDGAEYRPYVALVTRDPDTLAAALEEVHDDRELEAQLVAALGATHDPRALDPLLIHLAEVRTRLDTVRALEALGDVRAVPYLGRWVANDPYIPVRVAMAHALGSLGGVEARAALRELVAVEREAEVVAAARAALTSRR